MKIMSYHHRHYWNVSSKNRFHKIQFLLHMKFSTTAFIIQVFFNKISTDKKAASPFGNAV